MLEQFLAPKVHNFPALRVGTQVSDRKWGQNSLARVSFGTN